MGVAIPNLLTEDRVSGAQVIDGSLKFYNGTQLLKTPDSDGNRKKWTISFWAKRSTIINSIAFLGTNATDQSVIEILRGGHSEDYQIRFVQYIGGYNWDLKTNAVLRFGEDEKTIKEKLYERDIVLEFEKKVVYEN